MSMIGEVWRGERSLGETFWFWGLIVSELVIGLGGMSVATSMMENSHSAYPMYLYLNVMLPVIIWETVATWRSATKHPGWWASMLKGIMLIGFPLRLMAVVEVFFSRV